VSDPKNLLEQSFTAFHIAVPLETINSKSDQSEINLFFIEKNYDVLGYMEESTIVGYLHKDDIKNSIVRDFDIKDVIAVNTPLIHAISLLSSRERLFLMDQLSIKYIITKADLQKAPVRMLFFGLISLFESQIANTISRRYPNNDWQWILKKNRMIEANKIYQAKIANNTEIDLLDCTQLADKNSIIVATAEFVNLLPYTSKTKAEKWLRKVESLRNDLAHAQSLHEWFENKEVIKLINEVNDVLPKFKNFLNDY
jgi:hypothetical protein